MALTELNKLVLGKNIKFDLQLILHIQKIVMQGLANKGNLGKIRTTPVFVNDSRLRKIVYWPPDHQDVPQMIKKLLQYLQILNKKSGMNFV